MLFADLVAASLNVKGTRSRKKKTALLAECIAHLSPAERPIGVNYLAGDVPQGKIGLGYSTVSKQKPSSQTATPTLTVAEVHEALGALKALAGPGSGKKRAADWLALLHRGTSDEQAFLRRLVVGELRQGALEAVVVDAIAAAAGVESRSVRRAVMLGGDLALAADAAMERGEAGLAEFRVEVFRPLQPMLAQTSDSPADVLAAGGAVFFEHKLDGARVQIHRSGSQVRVFSRRLNDVTAALPEVVEFAHRLPVESVVLDGEVLALRDDGRPHPFQTTMKRFGRRLNVEEMRVNLPLSTVIFDLLHLDGRDVIDDSLAERLDRMDALIPSEHRAQGVVTDVVEEGDAFFDQALAEGHEGVMAKDLRSPYEAGSRGSAWLKLKLAHTLDLVILAAEWGSGRRRGFLSNLHLGARDPDSGDFVMLGKTFKGLTDAMLAWQTDRLQELEVSRDDYTVYVRPELVAEIAVSNVQSSPQYPAGLALRFARVKQYREDKAAGDADTLETVRAIHARENAYKPSQ
ncbi:MAG: ATP-dependent DNA ligase [Myxococcota bacterium]